MPIWELSEIEDCEKTIFPKQPHGVKHRFSIFGGVPRYILCDEQWFGHWHDQLDRKCKDCDIHTMSRVDMDAFGQDVSDMVRHVHPLRQDSGATNYEEYTIKFASYYVITKIFDAVHKYAESDMKRFVTAVTNGACHAPLSSLGGHIYEYFAHQKLKKGGQFMCRSLEEDGKGKLTLTLKKTTEEKTFPTKYRSNISMFNPGYWRPESKTYASLDSFYIKDEILSLIPVFQMTISDTHPFNTDSLNYLADNFSLQEDTIHYYFVVPPHRYKDFKKQSMNGTLNNATVRQYVMKVDIDDLVCSKFSQS